MDMRIAPVFCLTLGPVSIFFGCSTSPQPADAGIEDAASAMDSTLGDASPAPDGKADSATCRPAGAPCDDPFACCTKACVTTVNPGQPATSVCE